MQFIQEYSSEITEKASQEILNFYRDHIMSGTRESCNLHGVVNEVALEDENVLKIIKDKILPQVEKRLDNYFSFSPLLDKTSYDLKHCSIMHHKEGLNLPFHYDAEFVYDTADGENIRNFAVLVYLNKDFKGGELIFPVQGKSICPKPGLIVIFPTSFMYPHTTNPAFGSDRFVLRLNYLFKKDGIKKNVQNSEVY